MRVFECLKEFIKLWWLLLAAVLTGAASLLFFQE
jgi:hypothetical protein